MSDTKTVDLTALRRPFSPELVGKLPRVTCPECSDRRKQCDKHSKVKCGICQAYVSERHIHIDYVGHADVTDRLLSVDPEWNWEPKAEDERGMPVFDLDEHGNPVGMWIRLTVGGVTRLGYGSVPSGQPDAVKVLIGDALRNAAMRFGVALDLWAKGDRADPTAENATASAGQAARRGGGQSAGDVFDNAAPAPPRPGRGDGNGQQPARSWVDTAIKQAGALKDEAEAGKLWKESADKARAREITPDDAGHVQELISARVDDLRKKAMVMALNLLSENDDWRSKVEELDGDESARLVLLELGELVTAKQMDLTRSNRISRAIIARWPNAARQAEAA